MDDHDPALLAAVDGVLGDIYHDLDNGGVGKTAQEFLDALPTMLEAVSDMPYRWGGPEGSTIDASGSMLIPARALAEQ